MDKAVKEILEFTDFNRPLLLAVSGGKDSAAMLDMVSQFKKKFKYPPEIIHFNHGLRKESRDEEKFLLSLGEKYNFKVKVIKLDVSEFKSKNRFSTEEAARKLRYAALDRYTSSKKPAGYIYTAHTASDQAETLLLRIAAGTGRTGLAGIRKSRVLNSGWEVRRPLLNFVTEEIYDYIKVNKLDYVMDKSNLDTAIPRNFIRKKIIPLFRDINPATEKNIKKLADIVSEEENFLEAECKRKLKNINIKKEDGKIYIELKTFIRYNNWIKNRLVRKLSPVTLNYAGVKAVEEILSCGGAFKYAEIGGGWKARKAYGWLVFEKDLPIYEEFSFNLTAGEEIYIKQASASVKISEISPEEVDYSARHTEYFDKAALSGDNFRIRDRRPGDRMSLFGMEGTKKIKDICIDLKLPPRKRNSLIVIGSGNKIIWVAPCRRSAEAKVKGSSERIIKIVYEKR